MPDQPIDSVRFRKRDIVALHDLPSAQASDPIIVQGHHPARRGRRAAFGLGLIAALLLIVAGGLVAALESGSADGFIRDRARVALAQAVGPDNRAELTSAALRLSAGGHLALEARGVTVTPLKAGGQQNRADRILIALEPGALLLGRISVASVDIEGVGLSAPERQGFDLSDLAGFRIDNTETVIEAIFEAVNELAQRISGVSAAELRFSDVTISGSGEPVTVQSATLQRIDPLNYRIDASLLRSGQTITVSGLASGLTGDASLSSLAGRLDGFAVDALSEGLEDRRNGLRTTVSVAFKLERAAAEADPVLELAVSASPGDIILGGVTSELRQADFDLSYIPSAKKLEITRALVRVGETVLPFTGGLIDADRIELVEGRGFAFDFVVNDGVAAPGDSDDRPIGFGGKAFGWFDVKDKFLVAEELSLVSRQGGLVGSGSWRFNDTGSPEINLVAQSAQMPTAMVKQLWPYWIGKHARKWVLDNLYGGTIKNGRIQLAVPAGHISPWENTQFTDDQLQIDFDIERARLNVAGDIPPVRDTVGHMRLRGSSVRVDITSATAFFPTGRTVQVSDTTFSIARTNERPLMADLSMSVSGNADAVAELITYHPINALDRIGLRPEELSGNIESKVTARFGLIREQSPPPPDWTVELRLNGVDIAKPFEGRTLSDLDGQLLVTPEQAELKAEGRVDGAPMVLDVVQPIDDPADATRRKLSGTLSAEAREKLAPGSGALISGPVGFVSQKNADDVEKISLDLKHAKLTVPGIGWTKGEGVAATLNFDLISEAKTSKLSNLVLSGDGFEATGEVLIEAGRLVSANFDQVTLSPRDNYQLTVRQKAKGYRIDVGGKAVDARPIIALAKSAVARSSAADAKAPEIELSGAVDVVHGFSDEPLTSANVRYQGRGSRMDLLDFKAVTQSGQAVVLAVSGGEGGESIEITSGDAGAFARFAGVYARIRGGLLNIRLNREEGPMRRGVVDIRNFVVVDEERLRSLVSTPSKQDGRSLSQAVKADINVSEARFEMANARVVAGDGLLTVSEGIVRGPEIGASFQGTVYDTNGRIDLTGTFMPAYGLNRLFGELPFIGLLLGNGRDQGLIGITFRLTGKASSPLLAVNPLSVIAPGVFRSIFEFRR